MSVILIAFVVIVIKVIHSSCSVSIFKLIIKQLQVPFIT